MSDISPGPCPYCDTWLTSTEYMEGYCWNCKRDPHISSGDSDE